MFSMVFKLGDGFKESMEKRSLLIRKSMSTALKREGFLLAAQLKKEIRQGAPGGKSYPKLRAISRTRAKNGKITFSNRKPYTGIGGARGLNTGLKGNMIPIRYNYSKTGKMGSVLVGVYGSKSWERIFAKDQSGFNIGVQKWKRSSLIRSGSTLGKRSKLRKYFFLRKTTKVFHIPARPVIDPFWEKWKTRSLARLQDNFEKKMKGQRI